MVPSAFVILDALPLTPNGKVDRNALPAPEMRSERVYLAPRTPTEEVLAGILSELLGVGKVGVYDHFFELGGHSLLATQVVSRVREAFAVEMPLRRLFESPTCSELSQAIERLRAGGDARLPTLERALRVDIRPLSFAQERLWFLDQLEPESPFYNIASVVEFRGALSVLALEEAVREIERRHETLRTCIRSDAGVVWQETQVLPGPRVPLADLSRMAPQHRIVVATRLTQENATRPFDLEAECVFRVKLMRVANRQTRVALTIHHIASDGWSTGILVREVTALYECFVAGRSSALAELPVQYADFASSRRDWLVGPELDRQVEYWRGTLNGASGVTTLPADRPRPRVMTTGGSCEVVDFSNPLRDGLNELSRRHDATLFMTLLAAFSVLLSRWSCEEDLSVGTPIAGRTHRALEDLIGFFVNTLVMRIDVSGRPTFPELLRTVRNTALQAYGHQDLPFEKVVEQLQPARDLSRTPLFQVLFILQNVPIDALQLAGLSAEFLDADTTTTKYDLTIAFSDFSGRLQASLTYSTDLFDRTTIQRLSRHLVTVLESVVQDPDLCVRDISVLGPAERHELLSEWNDTRVESGDTPSLRTLFDALVAQRPDGIALEFLEEQVTYSELSNRAGRVAAHLAALGVGTETLVAVHARRSVTQIVAVLGVLQAGAAYLPLDPADPPQRLRRILTDAQPPILLASAPHMQDIQGPAASTRVCIEAIISEGAPGGWEWTRDLDEDLAYVIYTSGSTGQPRGVLGRHRGVVNRCRWMWRIYPFHDREIAPAKTALSFVGSVWETFGALLQGIRLVLIPQDRVQDPRAFYQELVTRQITRMELAPPLLDALVRLAQDRQSPLPPLRYWMPSGEALPVALYARYLESRANGTLLNIYGSSETSADVTAFNTQNQRLTTGGRVPSGGVCRLLQWRPGASDRH